MRIFRVIIVIFFIFLISFCCVRFFSKGYTIAYKLKDNNDFEITETYTKSVKNERNNYYVEIKKGNIAYGFQFFQEFENRKIVTDILHYKGEYECILPLIEGVAITDVVCHKGRTFYNYTDIRGQEKDLDKFVDKIDVNIYDRDNWENKSTTTVDKDGVSLYTFNVVPAHRIVLTSLKGVYEIGNKINHIPIFEGDAYSRPISAFVEKYYVTADYSAQRQFRTFYFVDLSTGKTKTTRAAKHISFDSYIQGTVDGKIYLYDRDNEVQYEIDPDSAIIKEVGNNARSIKFYEDGEWSTISTTRAKQTIYFETGIEDPEFSRFNHIFLEGNLLSGYYYLFEERPNGYGVYRAPVQNKKLITYLFQVKELDDVHFLDEYVYFAHEREIRYYSDAAGIRTIIHYNELEFNENLMFSVFK